MYVEPDELIELERKLFCFEERYNYAGKLCLSCLEPLKVDDACYCTRDD